MKKNRKRQPEPDAHDRYTPPRAGALSVRDQIALEQANTMKRHFKGRRGKKFEQ